MGIILLVRYRCFGDGRFIDIKHCKCAYLHYRYIFKEEDADDHLIRSPRRNFLFA